MAGLSKTAAQRKFSKVMREFSEDKLRSSSGEKVTDVKQAQAIAASKSGTARRSKRKRRRANKKS